MKINTKRPQSLFNKRLPTLLCSKISKSRNRQMPCQKCVEKEKNWHNLYFWFFITFLIKWQGRRQRLLKHFDNVFGPCHQIRVIVIPDGGHILIDVVDMRGNPWLSKKIFKVLLFSEKQNSSLVTTRNYFLSFFLCQSRCRRQELELLARATADRQIIIINADQVGTGLKLDNQPAGLFYGWVHWVHLQIVLQPYWIDLTQSAQNNLVGNWVVRSYNFVSQFEKWHF